MGNEMILWGT